MKIKNIGKTEARIINISQTQPKVTPELVAKALGAEYLVSVGTNTHNLPLPKPLQERLPQANTTEEKVGQLVTANEAK